MHPIALVLKCHKGTQHDNVLHCCFGIQQIEKISDNMARTVVSVADRARLTCCLILTHKQIRANVHVVKVNISAQHRHSSGTVSRRWLNSCISQEAIKV